MFRLVMIGWLLFPFLLWGQLAVDAIPLIAAGRVAVVEPGDLYVPSSSDPYAMTERFRDASCSAMPEGSDCERFIHPFTHPPIVLPVAVVVAKLPDPAAALVYRLVAALALVGGMALLWSKVVPRSRDAAPMMAAAAVLLTPLAVTTIGLGQSTPLLFLSVCLGVSMTRTNRGAVAAGGLWMATIVVKAYPAALGIVALAQRRWRMLIAAAAIGLVLLGGAFLIGQQQVFADFLESTKGVRAAAFADPYNRGIDGLLHTVDGDWNGESVAFAISILVRIAVVLALWRVRVRHTSDDIQWAFGWVAVLWFIPVVWFHYYWVVVGATFLMAGDRMAQDRRWTRLLPAVAALTAIGTITDGQSTVAVALWGSSLVVILVALAFFAVPQADDAPAALQGENAP